MSKICCVTGANSLVASWIINYLIDGGFVVRGTVRDTSKNYAHLTAIAKRGPLTLHQVADLSNGSAELDAVVRGCTHLVHVANPIGASAAGMSDEQFVQTSVKAVDTVFDSVVRSNSVKRLVVTATMASICGSQRKTDPNHLWCEQDWNDEPGSTYSKAKTAAEKRLWELAASHKQIAMSTIHPALVIGPLLPGQEARSTFETVLDLANGKYVDAGAPSSMFGLCDVRDVADAHVKALLADEAIGQRFMVTSRSTYASLSVCELIKKIKPAVAVPTKLADASAASWCKFREHSSDLTKIEAFLSRPLRNAQHSMQDFLDSMILNGVLKLSHETK